MKKERKKERKKEKQTLQNSFQQGIIHIISPPFWNRKLFQIIPKLHEEIILSLPFKFQKKKKSLLFQTRKERKKKKKKKKEWICFKRHTGAEPYKGKIFMVVFNLSVWRFFSIFRDFLICKYVDPTHCVNVLGQN